MYRIPERFRFGFTVKPQPRTGSMRVYGTAADAYFDNGDVQPAVALTGLMA